MLFFFVFQAEDGIRVPLVTGVQTCALPIWRPVGKRSARHTCGRSCGRRSGNGSSGSEERRVGKECRSRWAPDNEKKKQAGINDDMGEEKKKKTRLEKTIS